MSLCRQSVCLSVTFRYRDHIGWNTSKVISRPNGGPCSHWAQHGRSGAVQREHPQNLSAITAVVCVCASNSMRVAYLQSWCALSRSACLSQTPSVYNGRWLHLTVLYCVHRKCLSRAVTHGCVSQLSSRVLFIVTIRQRTKAVNNDDGLISDYVITCLR